MRSRSVAGECWGWWCRARARGLEVRKKWWRSEGSETCQCIPPRSASSAAKEMGRLCRGVITTTSFRHTRDVSRVLLTMNLSRANLWAEGLGSWDIKSKSIGDCPRCTWTAYDG